MRWTGEDKGSIKTHPVTNGAMFANGGPLNGAPIADNNVVGHHTIRTDLSPTGSHAVRRRSGKKKESRQQEKRKEAHLCLGADRGIGVDQGNVLSLLGNQAVQSVGHLGERFT